MNQLLPNASLFRHGQSVYTQGNAAQTLQTANDLLPESIGLVRKNALSLVQSFYGLGPKIHIHTSPTGRTIHTARIIHMVLQELGQDVMEPEIDNSLDEVHNFSWSLFEPLMNGGRVPWKDQRSQDFDVSFEVKKEETNPDGLGYPEYFMADAIHSISPEVMARWPAEFVAKLRSFERFEWVTQRTISKIWRVVRSHAFCQERPHHDIFVAHDGSAMYLLNEATKGKKKSLDPGTYMLLRFSLDQLQVVQIDGQAVPLLAED